MIAAAEDAIVLKVALPARQFQKKKKKQGFVHMQAPWPPSPDVLAGAFVRHYLLLSGMLPPTHAQTRTNH